MLSLNLVTRYLGVEPTAAETLIKLGGLPVVNIPTPTRVAIKVPLSSFHRWLSARSTVPMTLAELEQELGRIESE